MEPSTLGIRPIAASFFARMYAREGSRSLKERLYKIANVPTAILL
jgi:hypothetical protein